MARRPVYTDAGLHGPIVDGPIERGWDVIRAVDDLPWGSASRSTAPTVNQVAPAFATMVTADEDD